MKRRLILLLALTAAWQVNRAQGYYYNIWFDSNRGSMEKGMFTPGENELTLDLSGVPSAGLHFLNIIPYFEWGDMGVWKCIPFIMPEGWPYTADAKEVEYWVTAYDTKPKRKAFTEEALSLDIDISKMSCGLHFLNYRIFNEVGEAGPWKIIMFYIDNGVFGEEEVEYEYWIDSDEDVAITGKSVAPGTLDLNIDPSNLSDGTHTFNFKAKNLLGTYGELFTTTFYVIDGQLSLIVNPNINAKSKSDIPGWVCTRMAQNGYTKDSSGDTYFEVWNDTPGSILFNYYQDINLADGVYRLSAKVFNSSNGVNGAMVNRSVGLYAETNRHRWFEPVRKDSEIENADRLVVNSVVVTDGQLRVGVKNQNVMSARWAGADDFELTYLGTTEAVMGCSPDEAIYVSEGWQILSWPSTKDGGRDASSLIFNADASALKTTGWTVNRANINKGEASDGNAANTYFDYWNSSSFTSSMEQELTLLPPGDYTVSALLRCAEGAQLTLSATSGDVTQSQTLTGIGNTSPSSSTYQNGWGRVTLPSVSVTGGGSLKLKVAASMAASQWWSADDFQLTWSGETPVGIEELKPTIPVTPERHLTVRAANGVLVIDSNRECDVNLYLPSGIVVRRVHLQAGQNVVSGLKAGIYIIEGLKILMQK